MVTETDSGLLMRFAILAGHAITGDIPRTIAEIFRPQPQLGIQVLPPGIAGQVLPGKYCRVTPPRLTMRLAKHRFLLSAAVVLSDTGLSAFANYARTGEKTSNSSVDFLRPGEVSWSVKISEFPSPPSKSKMGLGE